MALDPPPVRSTFFPLGARRNFRVPPSPSARSHRTFAPPVGPAGRRLARTVRDGPSFHRGRKLRSRLAQPTDLEPPLRARGQSSLPMLVSYNAYVSRGELDANV